ncbi:MAG: ATP-binding protein [Gammaproteobacteria bacterium]|nr:ATP-binding protein [Gammaproteobacteria bacterium]
MRLSLKYRIALIIFLLEAIMMTVVLWQTLGFSEQNTRKQLAANEQSILASLSGLSRLALLTEEYAEFQPYLENLLDDPRIEQALLVNVNNRVVASTHPTDVGKTPPDIINQVTAIDADNELYWRSLEITNSGGLLGTLALQISDRALRDATSNALNLGISIAVIGMTIIGVIGLLVGIALTKRLSCLTEVASQYAEGDLSLRSNIRGHDEVGELGRAFDEMALALEKHRVHLQDLVAERTSELEAANQELEAFSYSVSHDLRAPLRGIDGFSQALLEDNLEQLDEQGQAYLQRIRKAAGHMSLLIEDLLQLARTTQVPMTYRTVDLTDMAQKIIRELADNQPQREVEVKIEDGLTIRADPTLMKIALDNLLGNAWKYTNKQPRARIEFGCCEKEGDEAFYIKDNGAGFDMRHADKLFGSFQRLHKTSEYEGTGIGLATVQRIIHRHGGRIWGEAELNKGASFFFTISEHKKFRDSEGSI